MTQTSEVSKPDIGALGAVDLGPSRWPYLKSACRHPGGGLEPVVPVTLFGPANWTKTEALLDSGADCTVIPYDWSEPLGVDLHKADMKTGWGNGVLAEYLFPVEPLRLEIARRVIDLRPAFAPWDWLMLGRDVFRHFRVTFDERARQVVLDPFDPA